MSRTILDNFSKVPELNTPITENLINDLEEYAVYFETKNDHPLALNTALLGVFSMYFINVDKDILFSICGIDESKMKDVIFNTSYIDTNMKVTSDPYNNLVIWTAHRILNSNLKDEDKDRGLLALFKMLHYKFFTSVVNHNLSHGANKSIMEYTIKSLSNKYDVIQLGTWKRVIEERSKDVFAKDSIHYKTLLKYDDDYKIGYILSDTQTRIRTKLVNIIQHYYDNWENSDSIDTYSNVSEDKDGKKVITATTNVYDLMISSMQSQIQSPGRFIDNELIKHLCNMFTYVKQDTFRRILLMITSQASVQAESNELNKVGEDSEGNTIYIGWNLLLSELIQKTYRYCLLNKIDPTDKMGVFRQCKNLYASSRVTNEDILTIKRSISSFVIGCDESKRDATNASICIALILYIIVRTFDYL